MHGVIIAKINIEYSCHISTENKSAKAKQKPMLDT
jgi:hypothetical protein